MKKVLIALLGLVVGFGVLFNFLLGKPQQPGPIPVSITSVIGPTPLVQAATSTLTVVSWNIAWGYGWGSEGKQDTDTKTELDIKGTLVRMGTLLSSVQADIVLLQEVDLGADRSHGLREAEIIAKSGGFTYIAPIESWRAEYLPYPYWPPTRWWGRIRSGAAILSRYPIEHARGELLPKPAAQPWWYRPFYPFRFFQAVQIPIGSTTLTVWNTHLEAFDVQNRLEQAQLLVQRIGTASDLTLLGGDFNSVPPEAQVRHAFPDEPGADFRQDTTLHALDKVPGLRDVLGPEKRGTPENFTFPSHAPNRRLDHIFAGNGLPVVETRVLTEAGALSDHLPIMVKFRLPEP